MEEEQPPTDSQLTVRVQRVFEGIFRRELQFRADLERAGAPGWTSLQHIEFLIGLEREFGIRFDGADATDMSNIPTVLSRVREKLS
jgi:acyl carrier protein